MYEKHEPGRAGLYKGFSMGSERMACGARHHKEQTQGIEGDLDSESDVGYFSGLSLDSRSYP